MGENLLKDMGFSYVIIGDKKDKTTYEDTESLAKELKDLNVNLIMFAGGDGTARNIYNAIEISIPVIGIPAGVKIHSAVYANNPKDGGMAVREYVENPERVEVVNSEVMDIDEDKFRQNIVEAKLYGYLKVPNIQSLMQQSKSTTNTVESDFDGMADEIEERMESNDEDICYIFGTGGTTFAILEKLGYEGSLLGVDILYKGELVVKDGTENEVYNFIKDKKTILVVTVIGGQGHVFGRGNQQLSPRVIREIGKENIWIVSSQDKIYSLPDGYLRVDTSDVELDEELSGYYKIIIGYKRTIMASLKA